MTYMRRGMGHAEHRGGTCSGSSFGVSVQHGQNMCVSDDQVAEATSNGCAILSERCAAETFEGRGRVACCPETAAAALATRWTIESDTPEEAVAAAPPGPSIPFAPMPEEWAQPFQQAEAWIASKAEQVATTVASWTGGMPGAAPGAGKPGAMPGVFDSSPWGIFGAPSPAPAGVPAPAAPAPGASPVEEPRISMASMIPGGTATLVVGGLATLLVGGLIVTAIVRKGEEE